RRAVPGPCARPRPRVVRALGRFPVGAGSVVRSTPAVCSGPCTVTARTVTARTAAARTAAARTGPGALAARFRPGPLAASSGPRRAAAARCGARAIAAGLAIAPAGGAMITRVRIRAMTAWAGARAVALRDGGAMTGGAVIAGPGAPGPRGARVRAHGARALAHRVRARGRGVRIRCRVVDRRADLPIADRAPGGLGRLLLRFLLGVAR